MTLLSPSEAFIHNKETVLMTSSSVQQQEVCVSLLKGEQAFDMLMAGGVTTLTFFNVPVQKYDEVCEAVIDRYYTVCRSNPWLLAGLVSSPQPRGLEMRHPRGEDVSRELVAKVIEKTSFIVNQNTPYNNLKPVYKAMAITTGAVVVEKGSVLLSNFF